MLAHLWTGAPAPQEYLELVLCRDVYHCTPLDLENIPAQTVLDHLTVMEAEAEVNKAKMRHK